MSPLEPVANGVNLVSILLAGRASLHTWWTGIVGCLLFAALFADARLYADATLQGFFIVTSVIGWRGWARSRRRARDGGEGGEGGGGASVPVRRAGRAQLAVGVSAAVVVTAGYAALLAATTDAAAPVPDSAVLAFSVLAQLLLMARCVEAWWFWLLVNTIAVPLYASRELWLTAGFYGAFWVNAVIAWRAWARQAPAGRAQPARSSTVPAPIFVEP
jgi:nicotinamide mononucleotide transporter